MPPPQKPCLPPPADPKYGRPFDPWNSASTGHQVAESQGPQGWRESRTMKLQHQFAAGHSGGKRLLDTVGAARTRARAGNSVLDMVMGQTGQQQHPRGSHLPSPPSANGELAAANNGSRDQRGADDGDSYNPMGRETAETEHKAERADGQGVTEQAAQSQAPTRGRKIFDGVVVYVNGSTHPLISDHKLKRLLAENGARTSIHLGRRQVTHVIVGKPAAPTTTGLGGGGGAGGGLAAGKLEKEIRNRNRGACPVKYVGVEWVLESIKAGKRLPEARFANLKVAAKGQPSVLAAFSNAGSGK